MDERDLELDQLLEPLRRETVSPFFLKRWRTAIERKHPRLYRWWSKSSQLAIATAAGFALGLYVAGTKQPSEKYSVSDATVEQVYFKAQ